MRVLPLFILPLLSLLLLFVMFNVMGFFLNVLFPYNSCKPEYVIKSRWQYVIPGYNMGCNFRKYMDQEVN